MTDGISILAIKDDIQTKAKNMAKSLIKEISMSEFEKVLSMDIDKLESSRIKYTAYYVQHVRKRSKDLDWMILNRSRFPHLSNSQVFNLIKLKEKLTPPLWTISNGKQVYPKNLESIL